MKDTRSFQKFNKGSYYTRSDIHNFYLNIPMPRFGAGNWTSGYVNPKDTNDLIIFMNIDVPGKSGHNYKNKYNESTKTIEWFGKPRTNSNQPTFAKLLSGKFTGHFFARWDNKQTEFLYLGQGENLTYEDDIPTKTKDGKDALCVKIISKCDDSQEQLIKNESFNFQMEKHLEEFIIANWNSLNIGKDYDLNEEYIEKNKKKTRKKFQTDTGEIDIFALSKDKKTFLVIELKKGRLSDKVVGQIQRYMGYIKQEIANDDQNVKGLIIGLEDSIALKRAISINPDIEYMIYKISFELQKS